MTEPADLTATEARRLIGTKALSPIELLDSCIARIEQTNPVLNALVAIDEEAARKAARAAEQAVVDGLPLGPVHGLPVAVKDNRDVKGMNTTHGSLVYKDNLASADDLGTARLRAAGAIPFAKSNLPEFGAGANTTNRLFGPTGNPYDPEKTAAGSSGDRPRHSASACARWPPGPTMAEACGLRPRSAVSPAFGPPWGSCRPRTCRRTCRRGG